MLLRNSNVKNKLIFKTATHFNQNYPDYVSYTTLMLRFSHFLVICMTHLQENIQILSKKHKTLKRMGRTI